MPPPIVRLPTLAGEPWEHLAVLGRLLRECAGRSAGGYVLIVRGHEDDARREWRVHTKDATGKSRQNAGKTLEAAFERALRRLVETP